MRETIEKDWEKCKKQSISRETFHCILLQVNGIHLPSIESEDNTTSIYLELPYSDSSFEFVPRKLALSFAQDPLYRLDNNKLFTNVGEEIFPNRLVKSKTLISDEARYMKGYSFPFITSDVPYYELRINPKNTGNCPGQCLFCHREISHRRLPKGNSGIINPADIISSIITDHGLDALKQVNHISLITELFGSEDAFLSYAEELKKLFVQYCGSNISFRACAQDVRSLEGMKKLHNIVDDDKFSYTLEAFTKRDLIMGQYKGIPLSKVRQVLHNAKNAGFRFIKLNYIAGIDLLDDCFKYMDSFYQNGLVDMLGLSIYTAFTEGQRALRSEQGWNASYYVDLVSYLANKGIALYEPYCFDMGLPPELIQRCRVITNTCVQ